MQVLLLLLSCFSRVWLCATPETAAHQAPPSLGFSRQEHWSGLPFPSPMHESEKWKWSRSVVSDSERPHRLQPTRLFHPWDFPGKSTAVGCHCLLQLRFNRVYQRLGEKDREIEGGRKKRERRFYDLSNCILEVEYLDISHSHRLAHLFTVKEREQRPPLSMQMWYYPKKTIRIRMHEYSAFLQCLWYLLILIQTEYFYSSVDLFHFCAVFKLKNISFFLNFILFLNFT